MAWGLAASGQQRRPTAATTQQSGRDSSQISARWHGRSPLAGQPSRELTAARGRGVVKWHRGLVALSKQRRPMAAIAQHVKNGRVWLIYS